MDKFIKSPSVGGTRVGVAPGLAVGVAPRLVVEPKSLVVTRIPPDGVGSKAGVWSTVSTPSSAHGSSPANWAGVH